MGVIILMRKIRRTKDEIVEIYLQLKVGDKDRREKNKEMSVRRL